MEVSIKSRKLYSPSAGNNASLAAAFFQLSQLLRAGVGIGLCLSELVENESSWKLRRVWRNIEYRVNAGESLSEAMDCWPWVFSKTLVALIRSGESSGELANVCGECQQLIEWQERVKSRFQVVLIYPLFAISIVSAVVGFLMVYLVPSLQGFIVSGSLNMSWHTEVLILLSQWLQHYFMHALIGLIVVALVLNIALRCSESACTLVDRVLLSLPGLGHLIIAINLSRYFENCSKLYRSGITLPSAMTISVGLIENQHLKREIIRACGRIESGSSLSETLSEVVGMPLLVIKILKAGEVAGQVEQCLLRVSAHQKHIIESQVDRIEKMIGPLLMMVVGLLMLWIVVSLVSPIYQSAIDSVIRL